MRLVLSTVFVLGLAATGAAAQSTTGAAPTTSPTATTAPAATPDATTNNDDVVSCRYEKSTGTLFSRRVCHTQKEWHQMSVDAKQYLENLDNGRQVNPDGGGG